MASTKKNVSKEELKKPVTQSEKEAMRAEILQELVGEQRLYEARFVKTKVKGSKETAERLNAQKKTIVVWELEEGEKSGIIEPVRVNGAVAWIPKGRPVLAPQTVADMLDGFKRAEESVGTDIVNQRGELGIKIDEDEALKSALDL